MSDHAGDPIVQCYRCRHYRGSATCEAYPAGIPAPILSFDHDHRKPYQGDRGIGFEPKGHAVHPADAGSPPGPRT